jgi:hypothetical protein
LNPKNGTPPGQLPSTCPNNPKSRREVVQDLVEETGRDAEFASENLFPSGSGILKV